MSNAGGMSTVTRYTDMLAGNAVWNPWEPQGAFDALATVTVPSGGVASVTFAGIPTGYKHLQIRGIALAAQVNQGYFLQINGDTAANYNSHYVYGDGSSATASANATWGGINFAFTSPSTSFATGFVVDILDYASTNKNKTVRSLQGSDTNGSGYIGLNSGLWRNTSAINSLTIRELLVGGNINQNSQFTLYGVR